MNPFGSYRALRDNAVSALMAAIEIYNKPRMAYRSECFVILLGNAWELILKAILSKNRKRIYYPKERGQPLRSLTVFDALKDCKIYFPASIPYQPVAENLDRLIDYRNNAIHFYNQEGFGVLIYGLAQTSIINFRDLVRSVFDVDIADEINLSLLPLSFSTSPDPIQFLKKKRSDQSAIVAEYLSIITEKTMELEEANLDTGRFLTVFSISLQSTKKVASADISARIGDASSDDAIVVSRIIDPNKSHPHLRDEVVEKIGPSLNGVKFTTHTFEAIAWSERLKESPRYYWKPDKGGTSHYSPEVIIFIKGLTKERIEAILTAYKNRNVKK
jgi:hypothetical protein